MRCWVAALLCCCCTRAVDDPIERTPSRTSTTAWSWHRDDDGFHGTGVGAGDVVTDLQTAACAIGDPLRDDNLIRDAPVWNRTWTLARALRRQRRRTLLVFDGVKMGASGKLNHVPLGTLRDQFLRYAFDVRNASRDLLRDQ